MAIKSSKTVSCDTNMYINGQRTDNKIEPQSLCVWKLKTHWLYKIQLVSHRSSGTKHTTCHLLYVIHLHTYYNIMCLVLPERYKLSVRSLCRQEKEKSKGTYSYSSSFNGGLKSFINLFSINLLRC